MVFESDYWRPEKSSLERRRQPNGIKRVERTYRRAFGRHRAARLEIRECAMEPSAIGIVGGVESWPLGCMPDDVQREFYSVYACRHNGDVVALFDSKSLETCRQVIKRLKMMKG